MRFRRLAIGAGVIVGLLTAAGLTAGRTTAAWNASTNNAASNFGVGTVAISTDLGGTVMFSADTKLSSTPVTRCIQVRYTGTAGASVRLYATTPNSDPDGLGAQVTLTIHEGTGTAGVNCAGFSAGPQIHTGTLANFVSTKNSFANGVGSWAPTAAENRMYRIAASVSALAPVTLQGTQATVTLRWEARSGS